MERARLVLTALRAERAFWRKTWNNTGGWLWRHKLAAYAQRHGIKDFVGFKKFFGARWAYFLQDAILAEELKGVVFPSFAAAMRSRAQSDASWLTQCHAEKLLENQGQPAR
jgi:hypothetical protein